MQSCRKEKAPSTSKLSQSKNFKEYTIQANLMHVLPDSLVFILEYEIQMICTHEKIGSSLH